MQLCTRAFVQALFVFRACQLFLWVEHWSPLWYCFDWGEGWREARLARNPANQFCLISHWMLSPNSPPQRGGTLSYCVCQQRKASCGGMCLTGTAHTPVPPLSLSCQSAGRQSHCLTIASILRSSVRNARWHTQINQCKLCFLLILFFFFCLLKD